MGAWDDIKRYGADALFGPLADADVRSWLGGHSGAPTTDSPAADRNNFQLAGADARGDFLRGGAQNAQNRIAPQAAGALAGDSAFAGDQRALVDRLRGQMNGQDSLAQLQLRDATDSNIAQQRSQAASASPGNAAMAQRLAMQNTGRINQGFGSQAAQLGIQERNAAANALGAVAQGARGQDQQQSQFNAGQQQQNNQFNVGAQLQQAGLNDQYTQGMSGLELANAEASQRGNMGYEQNQTQRRGQDLGVEQGPANWERVASAAGPIIPLLASDERLKTGISTPAGGTLDALIAHLKPQEFSYKDQRMGAGPRTGVMAQDVERGGPVGRQMVDDVGGAKMLDVNKSLGTALGLIGRLGERLDQVDGGGERAMATGGIVTRPTRALVGEAGPEAVIPLDKLPSLVERLRGVGARTKQTAETSHGAAPGPRERPEELSRARKTVRPEELYRVRGTGPVRTASAEPAGGNLYLHSQRGGK